MRSKAKTTRKYTIDPSALARLRAAKALDPATVGEAVREYRKYQGWTRKRAAKEWGMSLMQVKRLERGETFPFIGDKLQDLWLQCRSIRPNDVI